MEITAWYTCPLPERPEGRGRQYQMLAMMGEALQMLLILTVGSIDNMLKLIIFYEPEILHLVIYSTAVPYHLLVRLRFPLRTKLVTLLQIK